MKKYKLNELYKVSSGISKSSSEFGFGNPFLSFSTVFNNYHIPDVLVDLINTNDTEIEKFNIKRGDVFITRTSEKIDELGKSCVALKDYEKASFNGFCKRLRPIVDETIIIPEYAQYLFRSKQFTNQVIYSSPMSTRASLNEGILNSICLNIHSANEQQHIVDIIGSIDDKIENNNKIIEKLNDFMMFKYKIIYNEALKSNNQIHLENIIDLKTGKKDANAANEKGKYPFFTCSEKNSRIDEYSFNQEAILIAGNGNMSVKYYKGKFDAYQRTYVIGAKKYFYYLYLYYKNFIKDISVGARGSVIKFLTKSMLVDIDMPIVNEYSMKNFEDEIKEILNSIMSLEKENKKLNELKQKYLLKFF